MIGTKDINDIEARDIKLVVAPLWQEHHNVARKVLMHLRAIFRWSIAMGYRKKFDNPASIEGALGVLLESMNKNIKEAQNFSALHFRQVPEFIKDVSTLSNVSSQALIFSILTAARTKAVISAKWLAIDMKNKIWTLTIEDDKVKKQKRDRRILLNKEAVTLLKQLPRTGDYVFCSPQGRPLSNNAMTEVIKGLHDRKLKLDGIGWIDEETSKRFNKPFRITQHGTARSCFRSWAREFQRNGKKFDQLAVELCMLHSRNDVYGGAYDRSDLFKERREIMEEWGRFCFSLMN